MDRHTWTDRQSDSSTSTKTFVLQGYNKNESQEKIQAILVLPQQIPTSDTEKCPSTIK